ncbi:MAG: hypothetical protein ACRC0F_03675 [Cetobacterium sp.]
MAEYILDYYDYKDEKVQVTIEAKPMLNRWRYTELLSEGKTKGGNDDFKITFEIAKRLFPEMMVEPNFPVKKKISDNIFLNVEQQIKEMFVNDPQKIGELVQFLMGLMMRD